MSGKLTKENAPARTGERQSNIELFRIIVMLLIIAHHYVVNSNLVEANGPIMLYPKSGATLFLVMFGAWGKICINCFVFITGYFMCTQKISARKFAKLVFEVIFYKLLIGTLFIVRGDVPASPLEIVKMFLPITEIGKNFTDTFLIFYLLIPFLNKAIHGMKELQHLKLLAVCVFTYVILGTNPKMIVNYNYITWYIVIYIIASYIRLYPKAVYDNRRLWRALLAASVLVCAATVFICTWLGASKGGGYWYIFVMDCNTFLAVFTALSAFMVFKNLEIGYSKFINTVSASTFGVFLLHSTGKTMRDWLWNDLFNVSGIYGNGLMPLYAVGTVIAVFTVGTVIDICRIRLVEAPFFALWDRHWPKIGRAYAAFEAKMCDKLHIGN